MNPLYDFLTAVQFLTRIPVPPFPFTPAMFPRSAKFFPVVGALIGAAAALAHAVLSPHLPRLVTAVLTVTLLVCITGAFHEDGLADTADGLGGGYNSGQSRDRILEIFRDSRIGTYGGVALVLSLMARVTLLSAIPLDRVTAALVAAHILCRWSTLPLACFLPPARPSGDGHATTLNLTAGPTTLGTAFAFAAAIALLGWRALPALLLAVAVTTATGLYYRRRIGGVTGDCFGATNQLTEIAVYLTAAWTVHP